MLQLNAGAEIILAENPQRIRKHFWRKPFGAGAGGSTWGGKSSGAVSPLSLFSLIAKLQALANRPQVEQCTRCCTRRSSPEKVGSLSVCVLGI